MMKAEHVNPIFDATHDVLESMIQLDAKKGELQRRDNHFVSEKVNASIGVTGDLQGFIYFSLTEEMALQMISNMTGMEITEFDSFASSGIGELANIITGNSITNLSKMGYQCDITPPSIAIGENMQISTNRDNFLVVPLHTDIGDFEINVSLEETK